MIRPDFFFYLHRNWLRLFGKALSKQLKGFRCPDPTGWFCLVWALKVTETSSHNKRNIAAFVLKLGTVNRGLDECAHSVQCSGKGTHKCCRCFYRIWFFFTLLCSSPLPRIPLEIIRYHAENPSHKLNFEEKKQLDEDVSVAEAEQFSLCPWTRPPVSEDFLLNHMNSCSIFWKIP